MQVSFFFFMLIYKSEIYKPPKKKQKPKPLSNVVKKKSIKPQRNYKKIFWS